jgi:NAD(P)H-hydrate epimerase
MSSESHSELPRLPRRPRDAHKGSFGTALLVGGSRGMSGAISLAGLSALRGGVGLARLAVPQPILTTVASHDPCYTTIPLPADAGQCIALAAFEPIMAAVETATAVALGPGLGRSRELDLLVPRLYQSIRTPLVVDADGLNALAGEGEAIGQPGGPRVLTPHPGEFARLVGRRLEGDARLDAAVELAARVRAVVVLKGHRTLVTDGQHRWRNTTGNPGMATGGSGDVLTGLVAALLCQGLNAFDAARLAVYLHGLAGDLAAADVGEASLIATDLIQYLPKAFQRRAQDESGSAEAPGGAGT